MYFSARAHAHTRTHTHTPARIRKPAAESPISVYASPYIISCACFFRLPQNAYALLGKICVSCLNGKVKIFEYK